MGQERCMMSKDSAEKSDSTKPSSKPSFRGIHPYTSRFTSSIPFIPSSLRQSISAEELGNKPPSFQAKAMDPGKGKAEDSRDTKQYNDETLQRLLQEYLDSRKNYEKKSTVPNMEKGS